MKSRSAKAKGKGNSDTVFIGIGSCGINTVSRLSELGIAGSKRAFIFAGLGGTTGTSLAPVAVQVSNSLGIETTAVLTLPFELERTRTRIAQAALPTFSDSSCGLIVRDNNDFYLYPVN